MAASRAETRTGGRPATTGTIGGNLALSVGMSDKPAPEGWRWTRLTDVARLETGHTPSRKRPEYWEGEIPWIGIKDATGNHGRKIHDTIQHTNQLGIAKSSARILPENTVCLSRTASVGYVVVMGRPMATSQDFVNWVCSENLDSQFLKYVLLGERSAFLRFASGTTHQTIYFPEVKAFHVCLPPILEQRAIANILGTLDDKIELNRRMNETLEAMARALFKDWFVDFGPTRAKIEGRDPYLAPEIWDLFPEKLDEDGKPEGWETQSVIDQAEWVNGAAYGNMHFSNAHDALPVVKIAELKAGVTKNTRRTNTELGDKYRIRDRELLFSWSGNPDTSIDTFIWTGGEAWLNQHIFAVRDNGARTPAFLYTMLKWLKPEFAEIARNKQTTGLGHVTKQDLKRMQIYVGPRELLEESEHLIGPLHARMQTNLVENMTLAQTRDLLLPKLMSGEIRVSDADKIVKEFT